MLCWEAVSAALADTHTRGGAGASVILGFHELQTMEKPHWFR